MKVCSRCKQHKELSEFTKGSVQCKTCEYAHYREYDLMYEFGITLDAYNILLEAQNNVCAICKKPPTNKHKYDKILYVDHDHKTGKVRGLLCSSCNTLLGFAKDKASLLREAAIYLEKYDS